MLAAAPAGTGEVVQAGLGPAGLLVGLAGLLELKRSQMAGRIEDQFGAIQATGPTEDQGHLISPGQHRPKREPGGDAPGVQELSGDSRQGGMEFGGASRDNAAYRQVHESFHTQGGPQRGGDQRVGSAGIHNRHVVVAPASGLPKPDPHPQTVEEEATFGSEDLEVYRALDLKGDAHTGGRQPRQTGGGYAASSTAYAPARAHDLIDDPQPGLDGWRRPPIDSDSDEPAHGSERRPSRTPAAHEVERAGPVVRFVSSSSSALTIPRPATLVKIGGLFTLLAAAPAWAQGATDFMSPFPQHWVWWGSVAGAILVWLSLVLYAIYGLAERRGAFRKEARPAPVVRALSREGRQRVTDGQVDEQRIRLRNVVYDAQSALRDFRAAVMSKEADTQQRANVELVVAQGLGLSQGAVEQLNQAETVADMRAAIEEFFPELLAQIGAARAQGALTPAQFHDLRGRVAGHFEAFRRRGLRRVPSSGPGLRLLLPLIGPLVGLLASVLPAFAHDGVGPGSLSGEALFDEQIEALMRAAISS